MDCDVSVDRILGRILCWTSMNLSYTERYVLVNYVLFTIHTYWAQVFLIPKYVLEKITQISRAYLWNGKSYLHKPPLISWEWMCKPNKCGGL